MRANYERNYYNVLGRVAVLVENSKFLTNKFGVMVNTVGNNPNWSALEEIAYEVMFNLHYNGKSKTSLKKSILKAIGSIIAKDRLIKECNGVPEEEFHSFVYEEFPF